MILNLCLEKSYFFIRILEIFIWHHLCKTTSLITPIRVSKCAFFLTSISLNFVNFVYEDGRDVRYTIKLPTRSHSSLRCVLFVLYSYHIAAWCALQGMEVTLQDLIKFCGRGWALSVSMCSLFNVNSWQVTSSVSKIKKPSQLLNSQENFTIASNHANFQVFSKAKLIIRYLHHLSYYHIVRADARHTNSYINPAW